MSIKDSELHITYWQWGYVIKYAQFTQVLQEWLWGTLLVDRPAHRNGLAFEKVQVMGPPNVFW